MASRVDVNTATHEELAKGLQIGKEAVEEIVRLRALVPFESAADLEEVSALARKDVERVALLAGLPLQAERGEDPTARAILRLADVIAQQRADRDLGPPGPGDTSLRPPSGPIIERLPPEDPPPPPDPHGGWPPIRPVRVGDYILDQRARHIIRWSPGQGGAWTQNHVGEGYAFAISVKFDANGEIVGVNIVSTQPGGETVRIQKRRDEDVRHIIKDGPLITIVTDKRLIVYDGRQPLGPQNPRQDRVR
jgi:hypothetical protein